MKERPIMPKIKYITATPKEIAECNQANLDIYRFLNEVNQEIDGINRLIEQYNQTKDSEEAKIIIHQIVQAQKNIDYTFPLTYASYINDYRDKIHGKFVKDIQDQFISLDLKLSEDLSQKNSQIPEDFSEAIAFLEPYTINKILRILSNTEPFDWKKIAELYTPYNPNNKDHKTLKDLFETKYSIQPLGGGNSKNFKVTGKNGEEFTLKVENRLGVPKSAEQPLKNNVLADVLVPESIQRNGSFLNNAGILVTRTLIVTEYCPGGDLLSHAKSLDDDTRLITALDKCIEMAIISEGMRMEGVAFTDIKNTNWLLNAALKLQISDSKGFLNIGPNGGLDLTIHQNRWYNLAATPAMTPPECYRIDEKPSAEKIHAYMIGKNLYQLVTQCLIDDFYEHDNNGNRLKVIHNAHELPGILKRHPIFDTKEGDEVRTLILQLVVEDASARISVSDAIKKMQLIRSKLTAAVNQSNTAATAESTDDEELTEVYQEDDEQLQLNILKVQVKTVLLKINDCIIGTEEERQQFYQENQLKINQIDDIDELNQLKSALEQTLIQKTALLKSECFALITQLKDCKSFTNTDSLFSLLDLIDTAAELQLNQIRSSLEKTLLISQAKDPCLELLDQIESFASTTANEELFQFTQKQRQEINLMTDPDKLEVIETQLQEVAELMEVKSTCNTLIKQIKDCESSKGDKRLAYVLKKITGDIQHEHEKTQLDKIQVDLTEILSIYQAKDPCLELLNQIEPFAAAKEYEDLIQFAQEQRKVINLLADTEKLATIEAKLQEVTALMEPKSACNTLIKQINACESSKGDNPFAFILSEAREELQQSHDENRLVEIKTKLSDILLICQEKDHCQVLIKHLQQMAAQNPDDRILSTYINANEMKIKGLRNLDQLKNMQAELGHCLEVEVKLKNTEHALQNKTRFYPADKLTVAREFSEKIATTEISERETLLPPKDKKELQKQSPDEHHKKYPSSEYKQQVKPHAAGTSSTADEAKDNETKNDWSIY